MSGFVAMWLMVAIFGVYGWAFLTLFCWVLSKIIDD